MTEETRHNIRAIRELLLTAFSVEELRGLFSFAMCDDLHPVADLFTPEDGKPAMVRKAVGYCESRFLLDELLAEVKEANSRAYDRCAPELFTTDIEQPPEEETAGSVSERLTITSPIYLDLVRIPAGEFLMGSVAARDKHAQDDEFPSHRVQLSEFYIGQYPVTNLQYGAFIKARQHEAPDGWGSIPVRKENHPVVSVSWEDALSFCAWLSEETGRPFRLPTEAEWEKAARGTAGCIYPWGDDPPDESLCSFDKQVEDTTPIGRYSPQGDSPYGCADMAGAVWEWCQSLDRPYPYRAGDGREDLQADGDRVLRGGTFLDSQGDIRCAHRFSWEPDFRVSFIGFRVAVAPEPSDSFDTAQDML